MGIGEEETETVYIGIDPGKTGGICVVNRNSSIVSHHSCTGDESWTDHRNFLSLYRETTKVLIGLEKVSAMPGQGVVSMFTFGMNYGGWIALLEILMIPYILVSPQKWQKSLLGSFPKGESKQRAYEYVNRRYPGQGWKKTKDAGVVDAACIALYIKDNH